MVAESPTRFHLALPVRNLSDTRAFYIGVLGCREGRASSTWVDFDFFGHQLSAHLVPTPQHTAYHNPVDGKDVPVPHFGVILGWGEWQKLAKRLETDEIGFVIAPCTRFRGQAGEQATLFLRDPSGNTIEFKAFRNDAEVFSAAAPERL